MVLLANCVKCNELHAVPLNVYKLCQFYEFLYIDIFESTYFERM